MVRQRALGREQGFVLSRAVATSPAGPLTLSVAFSGGLHPSLAAGGGGEVTLARGSTTVLRYRGLAATDARGRVLRSWMQLDGSRALLRVDTRGARYPLHIDPFVQGQAIASGNCPVALSADASTALLGCSGIPHSVLVLVRSGGSWSQQGPALIGTGAEGPYNNFGGALELSANGNTAVIGDQLDNTKVGAVWIFTRSGEAWTQLGSKLTPGEAGEHDFGIELGLRSDGNTVLIGGVNGAWVFSRAGEAWSQQGSKLFGSEQLGASEFGLSVALSDDGNTAIIGSPPITRARVRCGRSRAQAKRGHSREPSSLAASSPARLHSAGVWRCPKTATRR